ncbi:MAG: hypothetical protein ACRD0P_01345, partial [Stackebrandtia sp.]
LDPVERWRRPVGQLLEMSLHETRGPMVAEDVRAPPDAPLTIVEGTTVTPRITGGEPAVWLLVSPETQRARLADRGLGAGHTSLYQALREVIARETAGAPVLWVDELSVEDAVEAVAARFADLLDAAPKANTVTERQELLRYANQAMVTQVRGFSARPWARGDGEATVKPLLCECGAVGCTAEVELPIGDYTSPLLADGHRHPG